MLNGDAGPAELLCDPVKPNPGEPGPFSQFVVAESGLSGTAPAEKLKLPKGEVEADVDGAIAAPNSSWSWYLAEPSALVPPMEVVSKALALLDATSAENRAAAVMAR